MRRKYYHYKKSPIRQYQLGLIPWNEYASYLKLPKITYRNHKEANAIGRIITKMRALEIVGNKCVMCGDNNPVHLVFDHKYNNGTEHRKIIGPNIRDWIINHPIEAQNLLQTLCANCHEEKRSNYNSVEGIYQLLSPRKA